MFIFSNLSKVLIFRVIWLDTWTLMIHKVMKLLLGLMVSKISSTMHDGWWSWSHRYLSEEIHLFGTMDWVRYYSSLLSISRILAALQLMLFPGWRKNWNVWNIWRPIWKRSFLAGCIATGVIEFTTNNGLIGERFQGGTEGGEGSKTKEWRRSCEYDNVCFSVEPF